MTRHGRAQRLIYAQIIISMLISTVVSFPKLYDSLGGCEIPTQGYGGHGDPEQNSDITFSFYPENGYQAVTSFVAGDTYILGITYFITSVTYSVSGANMWVHVSAGSLAPVSFSGTSQAISCTAAGYSTNPSSIHQFIWSAPSAEDCVTVSAAAASFPDESYQIGDVNICTEGGTGAILSEPEPSPPTTSPTATTTASPSTSIATTGTSTTSSPITFESPVTTSSDDTGTGTFSDDSSPLDEEYTADAQDESSAPPFPDGSAVTDVFDTNQDTATSSADDDFSSPDDDTSTTGSQDIYVDTGGPSTSTSTSETGGSSSSSSSGSEDGSGVSSGAILGIVFGLLVFFGIVFALYVNARRVARRTSAPHASYGPAHVPMRPMPVPPPAPKPSGDIIPYPKLSSNTNDLHWGGTTAWRADNGLPPLPSEEPDKGSNVRGNESAHAADAPAQVATGVGAGLGSGGVDGAPAQLTVGSRSLTADLSARGSSTISTQQPDHSTVSLQNTAGAAEGASAPARRQGGTLEGMYANAFPTNSSADTFTASAVQPARMSVMAAPAVGASAERMQEYVQYQLDSLGGETVLHGLVLQHGQRSRLIGGQAVVQFAKDTRTELEYAIKLFLSQQAFKDEESLYTSPDNPLGKFLPEVRNIVPNTDGAFVDAHGAPMMPCITMEKGESLDIWNERTGKDMSMIDGLQVIYHIAERLQDLHAAGYCHRDLKPGNVMWLPRRNRWTLIDFGCASLIGEEARLGYSLAYAAPEVIAAVRAGHSTMVSSDKLDAWSLGVMAVELLSNQPPFSFLDGREKVMDQLEGKDALPWEDEATAPRLLRRFGAHKAVIMSLLHRDPALRPCMKDFRMNCNRILMKTSTTR